MSDETFADARHEAMRCLDAVWEAFVTEVGGRPTLEELFEILGASIPTDGEHLEPVGLPARFTAELRGDHRFEGGPSRVPELNDAVFVAASDFLGRVAVSIHAAKGRVAVADDLGPAVLNLLRSVPRTLEDVDPDALLSITVESTKRRAKATVGDVLAIPLRDSGYRLALLVARNRFGLALGLFRGTARVPRMATTLSPETARPPVYTDGHLIAEGTWLVVGHDDELLTLFPARPEIYHRSGSVVSHPMIGEFGAAETADGVLRRITREEADRVGLLDDSYRQGYHSSYLDQLLNDGSL